MQTKDCILGRRSIRRYTAEPIPRETLEQLAALAAYAPSWKNTQIARYTFVTDRAVIERIAAECVLGFEHNAGILRGCAVLAVQSVVTGLSGYERDGSFTTSQGEHWQSFDAGVSAQTFCLAAHDMGIGSCILGIFDEKKTAEVLSLPEGERVSCLLPLGFPAESPAAPRRKGVEDLARFL